MIDSLLRYTILIDRSSSKCGNCGKGADPDEACHRTILGYGPERGSKGCETPFRYMTATCQYPGVKDELLEQFSQFEFVDYSVIFGENNG